MSAATTDYSHREVRNLSDFIAITSRELDGFVFRGHADAHWSLIPAIDRMASSSARRGERKAVEAFKKEIAGFLEAQPETYWDWLALAHYSGVPTRLLDWTRNPLVALYFAVADDRYNADGAVWAYKHNGPIPTPLSSPFALKQIFLFETSWTPLVRIARTGVYTIHPAGAHSLSSAGELVQLRVPVRARARMRRELAYVGISKETLFPKIPELIARLSGGGVSSQVRPQSVRLTALEEAVHIQPRFAFDAFVSYASEDREFVSAIVGLLQAEGLVIWFDQTELRVGNSLTRSLDKGVAKSRYAIVVLSSAYLQKHWTQYELKGLLQREADEGEVVLPVWLNIERTAVKAFSATLADKVSLRAPPLDAAQVAQQLGTVIKAAQQPQLV